MTEPENQNTTRRKAIQIGTATVIAPSFVSVVSGATDSGEVELTTDTTQPAGTDIQVRIREDTNGDGNVDLQQNESVPGGTGQTTIYEALSGAGGLAYSYQLQLTLTTTDTDVTPEISSATVTLPEESTGGEPGTGEPTDTETDPQGLDAIIDNYLFFVAAVITAVAGIGITSKSLAIGAVAAYSTFVLIAIETGETLLQNILIVTLVMIFIGFGFKFWRLEGMGEGS